MINKIKSWIVFQLQDWKNHKECIRADYGYDCKNRKCLGKVDH